ncbi:MAG: phosphoribosylaminoimidazolesuccinocarboxamide synthase [Myxococcales bacterium]|nr:phosphoribosylaminoimidazolesuccinocarboxamide synthase [Polyangiaceae bacterium]MDW8250095.1 phosphoribosylaminoimidazolesuccinocarboxamide synthase [Myxococcales bacterium]
MPTDLATLRAWLRQALPHPLLTTDFPELGEKYEGKVRDCYTRDGKRTLIVTDRVSAFDRVLGTLPLKGQVLNQATAFWMEATRELVPNHLISVPDPNVMIAVECEPLPVEFVVRAYLTGVTSTSIWYHYARGAREFCGHRLPEGLKKNEPLPSPILTPSTKAAKGGRDESLSRQEILDRGLLSARDFDEAAEKAMTLFSFGQRHCAQQGLILVDTKYEFGRLPGGEIVLIDEIHTPDSSRFWFEASYEIQMARGAEPQSFDKEFLRRYLAGQGFLGDGPLPEIPEEIWIEAAALYIEALETITGTPFHPNLDPPGDRLRRNLGLAPSKG